MILPEHWDEFYTKAKALIDEMLEKKVIPKSYRKSAFICLGMLRFSPEEKYELKNLLIKYKLTTNVKFEKAMENIDEARYFQDGHINWEGSLRTRMAELVLMISVAEGDVKRQ